MHRLILGFSALLTLASTACSGALGRGVHSYDESRYPEAVAVFQSLEGEAAEYDHARRARYALYRGLTHVAVGDASQAARWLTQARAALEHDPKVFEPAEQQKLDAAWRAMGAMPGEPLLP